jgi:DNA-binding transcriptional LysR family regulator
MSEPGFPSLGQLQVLLTVVDAGSFAAAARRLNRATSAITYAIDNLEAQLGCRCSTAWRRANQS